MPLKACKVLLRHDFLGSPPAASSSPKRIALASRMVQLASNAKAHLIGRAFRGFVATLLVEALLTSLHTERPMT